MADLKKTDIIGSAANSLFGIYWPHGAQVMALLSLAGDFALRVREDGTWYVSLPYVELRERGMLVSPTQKGGTPHEAIAAAWNQHSHADAVVVVTVPGKPRRVLRWNTFMWIDLDPNTGFSDVSEERAHP